MMIFLSEIKEILREADLMGFIKIGAPKDEYDFEAKVIASVITHQSSIVFIQKALHNIFINSFSYEGELIESNGYRDVLKLVGPISNYLIPAQKIHKLFDNYRK